MSWLRAMSESVMDGLLESFGGEPEYCFVVAVERQRSTAAEGGKQENAICTSVHCNRNRGINGEKKTKSKRSERKKEDKVKAAHWNTYLDV